MPRAILEAIHTNEFRFLVLEKVQKPEKPKKPEEANQPFDKLFESSSKSGLGPSSAGASGSGGGTLPRTYRRF